jgi:hypothetical protein
LCNNNSRTRLKHNPDILLYFKKVFFAHAVLLIIISCKNASKQQMSIISDSKTTKTDSIFHRSCGMGISCLPEGQWQKKLWLHLRVY